MAPSTQVLNFVNGCWQRPETADWLTVVNPATAGEIGRVTMSPASVVDQATKAASRAFQQWRRTPAVERVQYLFRFKQLLEDNFEELSRGVTLECGKTLAEARGEVRRGIENVEVACGIPAMMQGYNSENIARGIDETMIRQPVGIVAAITPFNFPAMIPLWFAPYAIGCGNCIIVKPSERVPVTMQRLAQLIEQTQLPAGVFQVVNGGREASQAILEHPDIRAISFVGSSAVARHVYSTAAQHGKRVQCQGGAKNPVVVLPDADMAMTSRIIGDSAFGCAGQRCLATSNVITVGESREPFGEAIAELARSRVVGSGFDDGVEMGPVISADSKSRIEEWIARATAEGAQPVVDGRGTSVEGCSEGFFVGPTILENVDPAGALAATEIFGPVLASMHVGTVDEAIELINSGRYGNMACLFTASGSAARRFRHEVEAGNIGINLGVAAPMASFPFSGWKDSFFGDLHGQGWDAIEFYTQKKVVVERWPAEWSRKF